MDITEGQFLLKGLSDKEVIASREKYGANKLQEKEHNIVLEILGDLVKEPMILLLLVAALIYFISGEIGDGIFLSASIILIWMISLYQESRSRSALIELKDFTQPQCKAYRNGEWIQIDSADVVQNDLLMVEEGVSIVADGIIIHSNDFSVNESILTGESMSVFKDKTHDDNYVYSGTNVSGGLAIISVTAVGESTKLGKIGETLSSIEKSKSPLEIQINSFVKKMAYIGAIVFLIVWGIQYYLSHDILDSLLKSLTLAMSILPEEIPVAYSVFMAIGAWQLMKSGIVVKEMKTVESLGCATVICTDKTGTITENKMSLAKIFSLEHRKISDLDESLSAEEKQLITTAMWASEPIPFDPMEKALHEAYGKLNAEDLRQQYQLGHEYPLSGTPPMMTHFFENGKGHRIVATKGAPEAIMNVSALSENDLIEIREAMDSLASEGYRILAVGKSHIEGNNFPTKQQEIAFKFLGLVAFYDPPKKNITQTLNTFYNAGILVKIITGDNALTTQSIAKQIKLRGYEKSISGEEIMQLSEKDLVEKVMDINVFSRMFPEAKLRVVNALKSKGQIVAMTGDGVNDGPALKAAHIGIAMGTRGSEIAKEASSLILVDDDLSKMTDAIAAGRKIYTNLKKAIQYIISIHIPIILTVFIPLALGWIYPNIFSPIHVVLLELIMGPTCSIVYQNEPIEKNTMTKEPRMITKTFFNAEELFTSIIQGVAITLGILLIYQYAVGQGYNENLTRTMTFTTLMFSNIFLTLIDRSFYYSIIKTLSYKNNMIPILLSVLIFLIALLLYVPVISNFVAFDPLDARQLMLCLTAGFLSVIWYEIVKWRKRKTTYK